MLSNMVVWSPFANCLVNTATGKKVFTNFNPNYPMVSTSCKVDTAFPTQSTSGFFDAPVQHGWWNTEQLLMKTGAPLTILGVDRSQSALLRKGRSKSVSVSSISGGECDELFEGDDGSTKGPMNPRYKTEMCRAFQEHGICKYGEKCQFAHGNTDLRSMPRHPKYKTELCKTFHSTGYCPYGRRCHFVHNDLQNLKTGSSQSGSSPPPSLESSGSSGSQSPASFSPGGLMGVPVGDDECFQFFVPNPASADVQTDNPFSVSTLSQDFSRWGLQEKSDRLPIFTRLSRTSTSN